MKREEEQRERELKRERERREEGGEWREVSIVNEREVREIEIKQPLQFKKAFKLKGKELGYHKLVRLSNLWPLTFIHFLTMASLCLQIFD